MRWINSFDQKIKEINKRKQEEEDTSCTNWTFMLPNLFSKVCSPNCPRLHMTRLRAQPSSYRRTDGWTGSLLCSRFRNSMWCLFPSEHQEQQVLRGVTTSPSTIRLTWRNIPSSQGYRLEWREGEGQACTPQKHAHIFTPFTTWSFSLELCAVSKDS